MTEGVRELGEVRNLNRDLKGEESARCLCGRQENPKPTKLQYLHVTRNPTGGWLSSQTGQMALAFLLSPPQVVAGAWASSLHACKVAAAQPQVGDTSQVTLLREENLSRSPPTSTSCPTGQHWVTRSRSNHHLARMEPS